jgi:hypothetical protein
MKKPVAFSVALALFVLVNVGVASLSKWYQPKVQEVAFRWSEEDARIKPWSWWLARRWLQQKQAPDLVLFGSSQMGSAMVASDAQHLYAVVDALTHRRAATLESELASRFERPVTAFSLASPGAMCSDAYMASSALFRDGMKPKVVVIGVSPRDFIDNTMPYPAATEPFKFYSQFVDVGPLTAHSYNGPLAWMQYGMESLPCRKLGTFIQASLNSAGSNEEQTSTKVNTALAAIMGGGEAIPGKWRVPAVIPPMWANNTKEYKLRFKDAHPPVFAMEKVFFEKFLQEMRDQNISVLVVGMPSLPMNRVLLPEDFWTEFRETIATTCANNNAEWLDLTASKAFQKADFLDTVHLNAQGGEKLFAHIAAAIQQRGALCKRLTGSPEIAAGQGKAPLRTASDINQSTH